ncbi:MAG: hypothetical protein A4E28_02503 [Methanocella sp. PtaU1.Bin125]|nr:MAG: hypothetical protein A4E28_02503 [Methanocella sp. PtaU1.Bin125]
MTEGKNVATGRMAGKGFILGGLAMVAAAMVMYFIKGAGGQLSLPIGAFVAGLLIICAGVYYYIKENGRPVADERSMRIFAQAGNITWFLTWLMLGTLGVLAAVGALPVSFEMIVWLVWIATPWVFVILRFVIDRRGEEV